MTTKVTVHAHASWPVEVTPVDVKTGEPISSAPASRVEIGEEKVFYVHSGQDLRIHEIQGNGEDRSAEVGGLPVEAQSEDDLVKAGTE